MMTNVYIKFDRLSVHKGPFITVEIILFQNFLEAVCHDFMIIILKLMQKTDKITDEPVQETLVLIS